MVLCWIEGQIEQSIAKLCPRLGIQLWLVVSTIFILYFWFKWLSASGKDASFQAVESTAFSWLTSPMFAGPFCLLIFAVDFSGNKPPTRALPLHDFRWQPRVSAAGSPAIDHRAAWAMNVGWEAWNVPRNISMLRSNNVVLWHYGAVLWLKYWLTPNGLNKHHDMNSHRTSQEACRMFGDVLPVDCLLPIIPFKTAQFCIFAQEFLFTFIFTPLFYIYTKKNLTWHLRMVISQ